MENEGAKRGNTILKILGILLAIGAVCFIAVKVYRKFFPKQQPVLEGEAEGTDAIADAPAVEEAVAEANTFEVPAEAVIANAEQMEA
jgi:hypothetical protein